MTVAAALFLACNVHAIAGLETAGQCFTDIQTAINDIERLINRPIPPRYAGPCPTINSDQQECRVALYAEKPTDSEICCWKCKQTHNIELLIRRRLTEVPNQLFTWDEVLDAMIALREPIPQSTWRRWRAKGWIQAAGELYGEPGYYLEDVRELRKKYARQAS